MPKSVDACQHVDVGPHVRDGTTWNDPNPRCSMLFQGPTLPCPMYHRSAICLTRDPGVWAHPVETGHREWDHSKVFRVFPGAHLHMSHVPSVGHLSHMGHWAVGPATRDETPWNAPIPGCSVSFQWPMYHWSAIRLTWDTGMPAP